MVAFYPLPRCLFYRVAGFHWGRFSIVFLRPPGRSEVKEIVHRMSEILFAAEIAFRRLNGCMPEQELNLLQLTAAIVAQFRAGPPQVVRCNVLQACSRAAGSNHVPHDILRKTAAPHLSPRGDRSKDFALTNPSGSCPLIESGFRPVRNRHRANVATFANQINNGPVSLAHLDVLQLQSDQFRPAKATTEQHGQHRIIALGTHSLSPRMLEHFRTLLRAQPITGPESELLDSFDAAKSPRPIRDSASLSRRLRELAAARLQAAG